MAREDEATSLGIEEPRASKSLVRRCEVCGVSGMFIEVREVWKDGAYFGTFCAKCELDRGRRRAELPASEEQGDEGRLPAGRARRRI